MELARSHIFSFTGPDGFGENRRFSKLLKNAIQIGDKKRVMAAAAEESEAAELLDRVKESDRKCSGVPVFLMIVMMLIDWGYRRKKIITSVSLESASQSGARSVKLKIG